MQINIIQKHTMYITKRNNAILNILNNLEFVGHSHEVYHDNEEIKARMKKISDSIENNDYEEVAYQTYMISKTESAREILDKRGIINKEAEELIDFLRDDIYEYWDCFDEVLIPLTKRPDYEEKRTTIKHKKNTKPTYPEWLGKVVK